MSPYSNLDLMNEDLHTSCLSSSCQQFSRKPRIQDFSQADCPCEPFPSSNANRAVLWRPPPCEWSALANGAKAHSLAHGVAVRKPLSTQPSSCCNFYFRQVVSHPSCLLLFSTPLVLSRICISKSLNLLSKILNQLNIFNPNVS